MTNTLNYSDICSLIYLWICIFIILPLNEINTFNMDKKSVTTFLSGSFNALYSLGVSELAPPGVRVIVHHWGSEMPGRPSTMWPQWSSQVKRHKLSFIPKLLTVKCPDWTFINCKQIMGLRCVFTGVDGWTLLTDTAVVLGCECYVEKCI